jgi:hypothetical protein
MDQLLTKLGISRESLTMQELETLDSWAKAMRTKELSLQDIKNHIERHVAVIEKELHGYDTPQTLVSFLFRSRRHRHLEARLMNYMLLRDLLQEPERARAYIETQMRNLQANVKVNG